MKFGSNLKRLVSKQWRVYYMDYDLLKRLLKESSFTEQEEAAFVEALDRELARVRYFRDIKIDEVSRRISYNSQALVLIFKKKRALRDVSPGQPNLTGVSEEELRERLKVVEEQLNDAINDIQQLGSFDRLNYTGFAKIIKKHDKHTEFVLRDLYHDKLYALSTTQQQYDAKLAEISHLLHVMREEGDLDQALQNLTADATAEETKAGTREMHFEMRTRKFWVHPDDAMAVKAHIIQHMPIRLVGKDSLVSSIYLDNENFEMYSGRIEHLESGETFRLRWYGRDPVTPQTIVYIERKTLQDDFWHSSGANDSEATQKDRFPIPASKMNDFLSGRLSPDEIVELQEEKLSDAERIHLRSFVEDVQRTIISRQLKPVLRTAYARVAFQAGSTSSSVGSSAGGYRSGSGAGSEESAAHSFIGGGIRMSLDTEVLMVREDRLPRDDSSVGGRLENDWKRSDEGVYPFNKLPPSEVTRLRFAILEVKLDEGVPVPKWLNAFFRSEMLQEVARFNKYLHGIGYFHFQRVNSLPFWINEADREVIRIGGVGFFSPRFGKGSGTILEEVASEDVDAADMGGPSWNANVANKSLHDLDSIDVERDELRDHDTESDNIATAYYDKMKNRMWADLLGLQNSSLVARDEFSLTNGKAIVLPTRTEPKTVFANERTFLTWLHFCIVLSALALGLLNFGDSVSVSAGFIFTFVAVIFMVYSLYLYLWRAHKIHIRDPGPYDDLYGPTFLVGVLFLAISINVAQQFA
ncbi:VTC domain-containing protein [Cladochytrium replicatum]|nr:VTC domain-containing protein [Cladochytrium replicatum]